MEEYEIECLRKEAEMEDEEGREESQVANEHWIDALERVLDRIDRVAWAYDDDACSYTAVRDCRYIVLGTRNEAAMNLPKDHEKYMDQQGDEPNKRIER